MARLGSHVVLALALTAAGCGQVLGLSDFSDAPTDAGAGGATSSAVTSASAGGGSAGGGMSAGGQAPGGAGGDGGGPTQGDVYRQAILDDGPIAYWRLEESDALGPAVDEVGNHDGTFASATYGFGETGIVPGSRAIAFMGPPSAIDLGDAFDFAERAPFTVELWLRLGQAPVSELGLMGKQGAFEGVTEGWRLTIIGGTDTRLRFIRKENNANDIVVAGPIPLNAFHHLVATYDGTYMRLFVDGVLMSCSNDSQPLMCDMRTRGMVDTDVTAYLGSFNGSSNLEGALDEVAVYDKVLSDNAILLHHAIGTGSLNLP